MAVGYIMSEQHHDMVPADVGFCKVQLARGIERHGKAARIALREIMRPLDLAAIRGRMRGGLAHLGHGDAADDPGVALEVVVDLLIEARPLGPAAVGAFGIAAGMKAAVERGKHMADDARLHMVSPFRRLGRPEGSAAPGKWKPMRCALRLQVPAGKMTISAT
ncbi:hypothetical protein ACVWWD_005472 [Mesorhizobium sp. URHB0026]